MRAFWSVFVAVVGVGTALAPAVARADSAELRPLPVLNKDQADNHITKLIFLNRCKGGCELFDAPGGETDARYNTSYILNDAIQSEPGPSRTVPEWKHGDAAWDELVQCVKDLYAPYDVTVTDVDPGESIFHHEAIVAGVAEDIGYANAGGVAPSICFLNNNAISFTFANTYPNNPIYICEIVGQETAHSFGLEHAMDCSDPMTYLPRCGRQFFRDKTTRCGTDTELDECTCGGSAQNSHRWLLGVLGANPVPVPGPDITFVSPTADSMVTDGFLISVNAMHMRGIGHVEFWINGTMYKSVAGHPYNQVTRTYDFEAPALPDGIMDIEIRATNDIGSESTKTITVTKGAPCQTADTCAAGQLCENGRCLFPPPTGALGDECASDAECTTGLCPLYGEDQRCSQFCFPTPTENTCPDQFECLAISTTNGICWPTKGGGGGGCSTSGDRGGSSSLVLVLLGLIFAIRRRR
jgi:MYXO-CTERM domain-containing protein